MDETPTSLATLQSLGSREEDAQDPLTIDKRKKKSGDRNSPSSKPKAKPRINANYSLSGSPADGDEYDSPKKKKTTVDDQGISTRKKTLHKNLSKSMPLGTESGFEVKKPRRKDKANRRRTVDDEKKPRRRRRRTVESDEGPRHNMADVNRKDLTLDEKIALKKAERERAKRMDEDDYDDVESSDSDIFESEDSSDGEDALYRFNSLSLEEKIARKKSTVDDAPKHKKVDGATRRSVSMPVGNDKSNETMPKAKAKRVPYVLMDLPPVFEESTDSLLPSDVGDLQPAAPSFSRKISSFDDRVKAAYGERNAGVAAMASTTKTKVSMTQNLDMDSYEAKIQKKLSMNNPAPSKDSVTNAADCDNKKTGLDRQDSYEIKIQRKTVLNASASKGAASIAKDDYEKRLANKLKSSALAVSAVSSKPKKQSDDTYEERLQRKLAANTPESSKVSAAQSSNGTYEERLQKKIASNTPGASKVAATAQAHDTYEERLQKKLATNTPGASKVAATVQARDTYEERLQRKLATNTPAQSVGNPVVTSKNEYEKRLANKLKSTTLAVSAVSRKPKKQTGDTYEAKIQRKLATNTPAVCKVSQAQSNNDTYEAKIQRKLAMGNSTANVKGNDERRLNPLSSSTIYTQSKKEIHQLNEQRWQRASLMPGAEPHMNVQSELSDDFELAKSLSETTAEECYDPVLKKASEENDGPWACLKCTFENDASSPNCTVCNEERGKYTRFSLMDIPDAFLE